jgi:uncharacterized protein YciW
VRATIAQHRHRAFVGRHTERQRVIGWLRADRALTKIVAVTGLGGIGKSSFLQIALHDGEKLGARTAWIDGRACLGTPDGILSCIPHDLTGWLKYPDDANRWILGIDNYEALNDLDDWLRHSLLGSVPDVNLLILVCERRFSLAEWQLDLGWRGRVEEWHLQPFTTHEVQTFLRQRNMSSATALAPLTPVPLSLAVYADMHERGLVDRDSAQLAQEAFSARLLREVLNDSWYDAINVLCMVSHADLDFLNAILDAPITRRDYQQLSQLSFITYTAHGLQLHDIASTEWRRDFRWRQPQAFTQLRMKVILHLSKVWNQRSNVQNIGVLAHDLVQLVGQDLSLLRDYADLSEGTPGLEVVPYEPADHLAVLECLHEWARPAIPMTLEQQDQLFATVSNTSPQSIRVLRDSSDEVVAMICLLPLTHVITNILERIVPDIMARLVSLPDFRFSPALGEDTYVVTMVGLRTQHSQYDVSSLAGSVLRYTLESSSGRRILGFVITPHFKLLLEKLGFVPHPFPIISHPDLIMYSLDLRSEHILHWAARMTGVALERQPRIQSAVDATDLRLMLAAYRDVPRFQKMPEVHKLGLPPAQVRRLLKRAIESFGEYPQWRQSAELIWQSYIDTAELPHATIAHNMHVSRATFYRHLARACSEFTHFFSDNF